MEFTEGRSEMDWLKYLHQQFQSSAERLVDKVPSFEEFWEMGCYTLPETKTELSLCFR